jgi:hypothetical protein
MVSPNDHVVMNHQNQTPNKWHMRPCSLQNLATEAKLSHDTMNCSIICLDSLVVNETELGLIMPSLWKEHRLPLVEASITIPEGQAPL